jgi:hypothetical protein
MFKGGANLIISPWVGFANNPFSASFKQTLQASLPGIFFIFFWNWCI